MKIPCHKCLKYPVCKHEEVIQCTALHDYMVYISPQYNTHDDPVHNLNTNDYWDHMRTIIPNIGRVYKEDEPWSPI